ncbi:MAG TPA: hypothetical protein VE441_02305 [Mycobacterium sp.]|nr:hypothetical protein [Mycobacterium sp.]
MPTPRKAGAPMWMVLVSLPDSICAATVNARSIGMAYAMVVCPKRELDAAVSIPITLPDES